MSAILGQNGYGKSRVRLVKVERDGARHDLRDLTVDVRFEGAYQAVHRAGDNSEVLPTDTMKNTVYALARGAPLGEPEAFGARLAEHYLGAAPAADRVQVQVAEHAWARLDVGGAPHPHSFRKASEERRLAAVTGTRRGTTYEAGVEDLLVMKTTRSAFSGYPRDRFTTLKETEDRILATSVRAVWRYGDAPGDFGAAFAAARTAMLEAFAEHDSRSVQHTLFAMGEAVLAAVAEVEEITLTLPNKHHLLVDLSPFGMDNPNEVFVATSEPYGLIEATVIRE